MSSLSLLQGMALQAGLIVALGAQNVFVIENGLKRRHLLGVALVCSLCDLFLILLGVLGVGTLFARSPLSRIVLGALGVAFLFRYALAKWREWARPVSSIAAGPTAATGRKAALLAALGFSLLNPHVYLDTVVLVGGYAAGLPTLRERASFGLGAALFSAIWFFGISYGAGFVGRALGEAKALRLLALVSAAVLSALGLSLAWQVGRWIFP